MEAGENQAFENFNKEDGMYAKFQYTMPSTSQKNGGIEQQLMVLFNGK